MQSVLEDPNVYQVIEIPASGITEKIIKEYNIHVVIVGEEYCNEKDKTRHMLPPKMP